MRGRCCAARAAPRARVCLPALLPDLEAWCSHGEPVCCGREAKVTRCGDHQTRRAPLQTPLLPPPSPMARPTGTLTCATTTPAYATTTLTFPSPGVWAAGGVQGPTRTQRTQSLADVEAAMSSTHDGCMVHFLSPLQVRGALLAAMRCLGTHGRPAGARRRSMPCAALRDGCAGRARACRSSPSRPCASLRALHTGSSHCKGLRASRTSCGSAGSAACPPVTLTW